MDLEDLKGKTLDDKTHADLVAHVATLSTRAETAEEKARKAAKESIDGRKTLKAERDAAFSKLGIETADELEALPDAKGQAEASKQVEAQLKKLTRERDDALKASGEATTKLQTMAREAQIASALEGQRFKNPADARVLFERHVHTEGDELLFKTDDGKLVPLKEGAALWAKARPDYLLPADAGGHGSGFKGTGAGGGGGEGKTKGDLGGDKAARQAAIAQRFPELAKQG